MLTDVERATLQRWARGARRSRVGPRARIVLACATGADNADVARRLGVSEATVGRWRARFVAERLDGLTDRPRTGRPRTLDPNRIEQIVLDATAREPPPGTQRWTTRSMATAVGVSQSTVARVWRAHGVQPAESLPSRPLHVQAPGPATRADTGALPRPGGLARALDTAGSRLIDSIGTRPRGKKLLAGAEKARKLRAPGRRDPGSRA